MEDCYAMLEQAGKGGADLIACPTWGWENIYGLARAYENSVTIAAAMGIHAAGLPDYCDPSCIVDNMGKIVAVSPYRDQNYLVIGDVDIKKGPAPSTDPIISILPIPCGRPASASGSRAVIA